ncbi:uncharacterized protein BP01DRAFT_401432 [Aspergillus saccharolyticus JOP 1030-1]|uniref:Uncharacterized protein n=1 Tax=Aspergillus saccharolyticus JOP 1030-1 TaxID=1450539 RepID=A0A318Z9V8_9EURO|nr:hypothetical protein BP01DRAFT_401432 [Aspergillus saccharolyticus JOP 1030-1]PYH44029.1 hypothetical protein BP01DRAFT_401432 [Aspergillus saccharolyticus JOP 1030-1]
MARLRLSHDSPIDPSYTPTASITALPATTPIEYILAVLERDGDIILHDLVTPMDLAAIATETQPWSTPRRHLNPQAQGDVFYTTSPQTSLIPGLVGKFATAARIYEYPVLEALQTRVLINE